MLFHLFVFDVSSIFCIYIILFYSHYILFSVHLSFFYFLMFCFVLFHFYSFCFILFCFCLVLLRSSILRYLHFRFQLCISGFNLSYYIMFTLFYSMYLFFVICVLFFCYLIVCTLFSFMYFMFLI